MAWEKQVATVYDSQNRQWLIQYSVQNGNQGVLTAYPMISNGIGVGTRLAGMPVITSGNIPVNDAQINEYMVAAGIPVQSHRTQVEAGQNVGQVTNQAFIDYEKEAMAYKEKYSKPIPQTYTDWVKANIEKTEGKPVQLQIVNGEIKGYTILENKPASKPSLSVARPIQEWEKPSNTGNIPFKGVLGRTYFLDSPIKTTQIEPLNYAIGDNLVKSFKAFSEGSFVSNIQDVKAPIKKEFVLKPTPITPIIETPEYKANLEALNKSIAHSWETKEAKEQLAYEMTIAGTNFAPLVAGFGNIKAGSESLAEYSIMGYEAKGIAINPIVLAKPSISFKGFKQLGLPEKLGIDIQTPSRKGLIQGTSFVAETVAVMAIAEPLAIGAKSIFAKNTKIIKYPKIESQAIKEGEKLGIGSRYKGDLELETMFGTKKTPISGKFFELETRVAKEFPTGERTMQYLDTGLTERKIDLIGQATIGEKVFPVSASFRAGEPVNILPKRLVVLTSDESGLTVLSQKRLIYNPDKLFERMLISGEDKYFMKELQNWRTGFDREVAGSVSRTSLKGEIKIDKKTIKIQGDVSAKTMSAKYRTGQDLELKPMKDYERFQFSESLRNPKKSFLSQENLRKMGYNKVELFKVESQTIVRQKYAFEEYFLKEKKQFSIFSKLKERLLEGIIKFKGKLSPLSISNNFPTNIELEKGLVVQKAVLEKPAEKVFKDTVLGTIKTKMFDFGNKSFSEEVANLYSPTYREGKKIFTGTSEETIGLTSGLENKTVGTKFKGFQPIKKFQLRVSGRRGQQLVELEVEEVGQGAIVTQSKFIQRVIEENAARTASIIAPSFAVINLVETKLVPITKAENLSVSNLGIKTKTESLSIPKTENIAKTIGLVIPQSIINEKSEAITRNLTLPKSETLTRTSTKTLQKTQSMTLQRILTQTITLPKTIPIITPKIVPKVPPPFTLSKTQLPKSSKRFSQAFDVYLRESAPKGKGKVFAKLIGKALPKNVALRTGLSAADITSARTTILVPVGTTNIEDIPEPKNLLERFRQPIGRTKIREPGYKFVEKSKYAISSHREKIEIPYKAAQLRRNFFRKTK